MLKSGGREVPYLHSVSSTRNKRRKAQVSFLRDVDSRDPHSMMADCMWYVHVEGSEIWSDVLDLLWQILRVYRGDCRHGVMCRIFIQFCACLLISCDLKMRSKELQMPWKFSYVIILKKTLKLSNSQTFYYYPWPTK